MSNCERGVIQHREFAQQIRVFKGLQYGNKTPTDIDAFLDFENRRFVFIEGKYDSTQLKTGQRLALEHLADACQRGGVNTIVLVGEHHTKHEDDVDYAAMQLRNFFYKGKWRAPKKPITIRNAVDRFLEGASQ